MPTESKRVGVKDLLEFYLEILDSLSMSIDDDGFISMKVGTSIMPAFINSKRLVLPTGPILRDPDWDSYIPFHPLSEQVNRGESAVIKRMKDIVTFRLTSIMLCLITNLIDIVMDPEKRSKLTPRQSEIIDVLKGLTNNSVAKINKIVGAIDFDGGDNKLMSVYLKRGGTFEGKVNSVVAVVNFPILKKIDHEKLKVFNVTLGSKKELAAVEGLLDFILPHMGEKDYYNAGSNSLETPYLDSLMKAFAKVAKQLNIITSMFNEHLDNPEELMVNLSWLHKLEDLHLYKSLIPSLEGNTGSLSVTEVEQSTVENSEVASSDLVHTKSSMLDRWAEGINNRPITEVRQPEVRTPVIQNTHQSPTPQRGQSGGAISWDEAKARLFKQPQSNSGYNTHQQPMHPHYAPSPPPPPPGPPPGFAGAPYSPRDVVSYYNQSGQGSPAPSYGRPSSSYNSYSGGYNGGYGGGGFNNGGI